MSFPANLVIIIAGYYLAFRVSFRGAFHTGLGVGIAAFLLIVPLGPMFPLVVSTTLAQPNPTQPKQGRDQLTDSHRSMRHVTSTNKL